jgi:hypothetical protein
LRIASSPYSAHVTGDISVWPKTATFAAPGNVSLICRSSVSVAGAAPQLIVFSFDRSRVRAAGSAHTAT